MTPILKSARNLTEEGYKSGKKGGEMTPKSAASIFVSIMSSFQTKVGQ